MSLSNKILALDRARSAVPHAFGGAISPAYHAEPRATIDINVFVSVERAAEVFAPLIRIGTFIGQLKGCGYDVDEEWFIATLVKALSSAPRI